MTQLPPPLPDIVLDPIVRLALAEDLGRAGDLTTDATIPPETQMRCHIQARDAGMLAGSDAARYALSLIDLNVDLTTHIADGQPLKSGDRIATLSGCLVCHADIFAHGAASI